ncbi:unnamed protein product, partial [marine sediment metagenome]
AKVSRATRFYPAASSGSAEGSAAGTAQYA